MPLERYAVFDPVGHYARPDVFRLEVDRRNEHPAMFTDQHSDATTNA